MSISRSATLTNPFSTSNEILKVENCDVQWDETIIAMRKEPDEQIFFFGKYSENMYDSFKKSEQLTSLV